MSRRTYNPEANQESPVPHTIRNWRAWKRKRLLLFGGLPLLLLLVGGGAYAAINLNAPAPAQHAALSPGINVDSGEKGLVGWWKLNGNTKDSTPYADDGTITGGVTSTTDRQGQANGAYSFNGTDGAINCGNSSILKPTAAVSISAWVYPTATATLSGIVNFGSGGYWLYLSNSKPVLYISTGAAVSDPSTVSLNQWHHIVGTYDGTTSKMYVDGQLVGTGTTITGPITNYVAPCYIGSVKATAGRYFPGSISDVRIYNRAISATDVSNLYNSYNSQINLYQSPGSGGNSVNLSNGLIAYWRFNGNAIDATPYSNNGTTFNVTSTTNQAGVANGAYSFDGSTSYISVPDADVFSLNSLTTAGWVKLTASNTGTTRIISQQASSTLWSMNINGNKLYVNFSIDGVVRSCGPTLNDGNWHFVAVTRDVSTSTLTLWVDGASVCSSTSASTAQYVVANPVYIGTYHNSSQYLYGSLSDLRVYNRALSAAEVAALYSQGN